MATYRHISKLLQNSFQTNYNRISQHLLRYQSRNHYGFKFGFRIEDALLYSEVAIECHLEFQLPLWILRMDIRNSFDTIEQPAIMQALRSKGLPDEQISLLTILFANQKGIGNHNSKFPNSKRIK